MTPSPPHRILLMAHCLLGDSLVMIPALRALRERFPAARVGLLSERHRRPGRIRAVEVLGGRGLVDEFHEMLVGAGRLAKGVDRLRLLCRLRRQRWDLGIVLVPPHPPATARLLAGFGRYLRWFGARQVLLPGPVTAVRRDAQGCALPAPHVADALLGVLGPLGIAAEPGRGNGALPSRPGGFEIPAFPPGLVPVAVAPGTNMPCKRWPLERYIAVLRDLGATLPVHPVLFGGEGDRADCAAVLAALGRAGTLVVGEPVARAAAIMAHCAFYLGNDTGLMHLAAALGKPCVAVFSARDLPGAWYPYGTAHRVFRTPLPCDACFGTVCPLGTNECILRIGSEEVRQACREVGEAL
ncbi:MAG: glycosyltransferase family 9 protein [Lentisphaeria bacterium]|jgi:ADP-heptose:LPS heptosyltransferase|nr:glycosyltransferase family 9 protein [Lentisphaeria bacterium]